MMTPSLLLGASILFWGWQTHLLFLALPLAVVVEGARFVRTKWNFTLQDFNRISDLCSVFFLISAVYPYFSDDSNLTILVALQLLPLTLSPLVISQFYSTSKKIDVSSLFMIFRRFKNKGTGENQRALNLSYPYFSVCILSASIANSESSGFFLGFALLTAWALFSSRPKRVSLFLWGVILIFIFSAGFVGQRGLRQLQVVVEKVTTEWFFKYFTKGDFDPYSRVTAIGDIGHLKMSDRIVFRVGAEDPNDVPGLLYEASYNVYMDSSWYASKYVFEEVAPEDDMISWLFPPCPETVDKISVYDYLEKGRGVLKLPPGVCRIENLPVGVLKKNRYGVIKVDKGQGFVNYHISFDNKGALFDRPFERDLLVPPSEKDGILLFMKEMALQTSSTSEILKTLNNHFYSNFKYSLQLKHDNKKQTPLTDFLLNRKEGHCEYFASATVLILRAAGIPARYMTGYSVQEFSPLGNCYVVRARHAHAWALAYVNGKWIDFDTTPPSWMNIENDDASMWESLIDIFSWGRFYFSRFKSLLSDDRVKDYLAWLLIPLVLFLVKRTFYNKNISSIKNRKDELERDLPVAGNASEFYRIENVITEMGYERYKGETFSDWLMRIKTGMPHDIEIEPLYAMLDIHYRLRFDPKGRGIKQQGQLLYLVEKWLGKNRP